MARKTLHTHRMTDPDEIVKSNQPKPEKAKAPEAPVTFTEEQQNAYAAAQMSAPQRNVKPYDDIHDWYRRTKGGLENA